MGENMDVPAGNVSESTVTESEHVAGESLVGSVDGAVQGHIEGSFGEGVDGDSCHGDDIMVEVLGSDVYVGGVCTSGSGENLDEETVDGVPVDAEVVSERPMNPSGGDGGAIDGLDSRDVGCSNREMGTENEESLRVSELGGEISQLAVEVTTREAGLEVEVAEGAGRDSQMVCGGDEASNVGNCADSGAVLGFAGGETEGNHVADVELVAREEGVEGEMQEVGAKTGGSDAGEDLSKREVEAPDGKEREPGGKDGDEGLLVGSQGGESQVVEEVALMESADLGSGLVVESMKQDREVVVGGVDALNDSKTQTDGLLDEMRNSGIETIVTNSETVENASAGTQVHVEKSAVMVHEEGLNPKKPLDEQSHNTDAGEVGGVDKAVILSSKVAVWETDAMSEHVSCLVDEQQVNIERGVGSTENHSNVNADSESSCQPTQVVVESEVSVTDCKVVSISQQDESLKPEEYIDNNMACNIPQVDSNMGQEMEIDGQVKDAEQVGSDGRHDKVLVSDNEVPGPTECLKSEENLEKRATCDVSCANTVQQIEVKEKNTDAQQIALHEVQQIVSEKQQEMSKKTVGITENEDHVCADVTSLCQPTQVVQAEGSAPSNSVSNSVDKAVLSLPSGNDENAQTQTVWSTETDNQVTDVRPMETDEVLISATEVQEHSDTNENLNSEKCLEEGLAPDFGVSERNIPDEAGVKEQVPATDDFGLHGEQEFGVVKEVTDSEQANTSEEKAAKWDSLESGSLSLVHHPSYELPPEDEGVFSVPDLVWGKVKSHPWWPGQIFDFTDASEKAMKHHKKDCFLVAYFGDRTFAWNEASTLRPFRTHFSQMEKHCNAETFHNAVDCALEEVSRRVELGLACSCIPKDFHEKIQFQIVENAGIRPESSRRDGVDESLSARFFQADKLLEYVKALARFPTVGSDHLELEVAKAQLLAFCHFNGYCSLPEFQFCGELVENNTVGSRFQDSIHPGEVIEHENPVSKDDEQTSSSQEMLKLQNSSSHKRKHNLREGLYPKLKEKSMSELMGGAMDSPDDDNLSGKRRKGADYHADELTTQDGRKTVSGVKVSNSTPFPKQSFKIGECIRRVASQMTGSPTMKGSSERIQKLDGSSDRPGDGYDISFQSSEDAYRGRVIDPIEYSSLDDLLLQLHFVAQDPAREYNFSNVIVNFFSDFRNSVLVSQYSGTELFPMDKASGKRKKGSPETFEFDDMNDTYWTDRVIQNGSEEQPPRRNKKKDYQLAPIQSEKPLQESRRPYNRKRYSNGDHALTPEKPAGYVNENAPAELIMNFSEVKCMPSETNLNKMFRRFGPLKEMETEVDRESSRARVVFKKSSDAEVAYSSAGKFNIFGPTLVNYQLSYTPTLPFKASPVVVTTQDHEMQLDLSAQDHEMQLDLSTHEHEMQLDLSGHDHEMQLDLSNLSSFEVNLV